ncbi:hypothetical protein AKJ60_01195 [candidate division MSBL1 archaeon SCGC-AAA385M11]|nr:hypothetical protein AKJ60_01195 [candidate division MSBL1 archaeon SCGC-AAA385M11]
MFLKPKVSIWVKFCGGCNPDIDRRQLFKRLKSLLESSSNQFSFVQMYNEAEIILLINGCPHACLEQGYYFYNSKYISIQGKAMHYQFINENSLPTLAYEEILNLS